MCESFRLNNKYFDVVKLILQQRSSCYCKHLRGCRSVFVSSLCGTSRSSSERKLNFRDGCSQGRKQKKSSAEADISGPLTARIGMQGMRSIAVDKNGYDQTFCKYWPYSTVVSLVTAVIILLHSTQSYNFSYYPTPQSSVL